MAEPVPDKGRVLVAMSAFWFAHTAAIAANHLVSCDLDDFPDGARDPWLAGRSMLVRRAEMVPIECVVRGYLDGLGVEGVPGRRDHARCAAAAGAPRGREAARAGVHPGHQGARRAPRREHLLRRRSRSRRWRHGGGVSRPGAGALHRRARPTPRPVASSSPTRSSSSASSTVASSWPTRCSPPTRRGSGRPRRGRRARRRRRSTSSPCAITSMPWHGTRPRRRRRCHPRSSPPRRGATPRPTSASAACRLADWPGAGLSDGSAPASHLPGPSRRTPIRRRSPRSRRARRQRRRFGMPTIGEYPFANTSRSGRDCHRGPSRTRRGPGTRARPCVSNCSRIRRRHRLRCSRSPTSSSATRTSRTPTTPTPYGPPPSSHHLWSEGVAMGLPRRPHPRARRLPRLRRSAMLEALIVRTDGRRHQGVLQRLHAPGHGAQACRDLRLLARTSGARSTAGRGRSTVSSSTCPDRWDFPHVERREPPSARDAGRGVGRVRVRELRPERRTARGLPRGAAAPLGRLGPRGPLHRDPRAQAAAVQLEGCGRGVPRGLPRARDPRRRRLGTEVTTAYDIFEPNVTRFIHTTGLNSPLRQPPATEAGAASRT